MQSKVDKFEAAIQEFGVDAALEYFDVPEDKRKLFKQFQSPQSKDVEANGDNKILAFLKKYYEWDEEEFEPQVGFAKVSMSDLEQLINEWEQGKLSDNDKQ